MLFFLKNRCFAAAFMFCCAFQSCHIIPDALAPVEQDSVPISTIYTIKEGSHHAEQNPFMQRNVNKVRFTATFDSTAIYAFRDTANQRDMNKLYGLADCNTSHHSNSVRFGWRWYKNRLEVHGYTYNNKALVAGFIGLVKVGKASVYEITLEDSAYVLTLDGKSVKFPRACSGTANGYKLYPYFGGDEVAPHDVTIAIQEFL
ncbi:hypothetical protein ACFS7Z_01995 [Pontibacter toksunensis]|uniref:Lipoprotein n=1 Tax=Pontibacter toksunensis TaxID=1332631 RepID=A0ABW6BQ39_9BACT